MSEPVSLLEVTAAAGDYAQEQPLPLLRELPPPEAFPFDALGTTLGPAALKMHQSIQAPDAICGNSVLAAATLAVQAHVDIEIDGRRRPVSEYFVSAAETGERKSAVDEHALRPIREHQKTLAREYDGELEKYELFYISWKKTREDLLRKNKDFESRKAALEELGPPPEKPLTPIIVVEEPTYEGLTKMLANGQPSVGLFSDEGGRLVGGHGMNKDNQLKTAAGISNLWDGKEISRVRASEDATILYGRRVSTHLMMQPVVMQMLMSNGLLQEQGLLSRCLSAVPVSTAGTRSYKSEDLAHDPVIAKYSSALAGILQSPLPLAAETQNELQPRPLALSPGAKQVWVSFYNHVEKQVGQGGGLAVIRGLANKAPEHVGRLAAVLAFIENPDCTDIDTRCISAGIELVQYYLGEALRLFGGGVTKPNLLLAMKLLEWAQAQEDDFLHLRRIYQYGPNAIRDSRTARSAVSVLEEHGWFARIEEGKEIDGSYRADVWRVWK